MAGNLGLRQLQGLGEFADAQFFLPHQQQQDAQTGLVRQSFSEGFQWHIVLRHQVEIGMSIVCASKRSCNCEAGGATCRKALPSMARLARM